MGTHVRLWWILFGFFLVVAAVYTLWSNLAHPGVGFVKATEWVGTVALLFTALMAALIAFYVSRVHKAQRGELPEDILTADIDDGDPELGEYSPWSWWPLVLAFAASLGILGLAVGTWIFPIGLGVFVIAIVGWVYEYYRGHFAR